MKLSDVSIVTYPAYPQTDVSIRSLFEEEGFDYDNWTKILLRINKSIPLINEDREYLDKMIDLLKNYVKTTGQDEENSSKLSIMLKRCELAEKM